MLRRTVLAAPLLAMLAASGCGLGREAALRLMVPNAPGSGYDITARTVATALHAADVHRGIEVFNLPGAGGMVGLQRLAYERGNSGLIMLMGLGLVGAQHTSSVPARLADVTALARLIQEPEIVVVTRDSPMASLADLVQAWRADPAGLPVGGGSSRGGPDHLATMLMADAAGIAPPTVRYRQFDGGGALLAAVLGKRVAFAMSSLGEYAEQIDAGQLRVLAVTGRSRAAGVDAPTLREAGLDVVFDNWRGLVAPPGLSADQRATLSSVVVQLRASGAWQEALTGHRWTDAYQDGDEFAAFLREQDESVTRILDGMGLVTPSASVR
ncbi:tripartite tricarboxylate transporter substrate binding protein [Catellatospora citrea]|uniref:tripartite tricarboxylate transporter substrate binding protein n=1 Tax=Catellatospora citrea TaxID=53366 RepID=UPI0033F57B07